MDRREFLRHAAALAAAGGLPRAAAAAPRRPNVLLFLCDDLGWGDLSCYGQNLYRTPNLDRLAAGGTLFGGFYVANPVCSPSRTAFLTGQFPARHRIHGHLATPEQNANRGMPNWLDPAVPTLPRLLQQAGYATAHFGKWHLSGGQGAPRILDYGFDESRATDGGGTPLGDQRDPYFRAQSTALMVDGVLEFAARQADRPWYANLWTLIPHAPLRPTDEQLAAFQRFAPGEGLPFHSAQQIYYATIADLDQQVGRLLDGLARLGIADDTLILFSSDNGPEDIFIRNASHSGVGSTGPLRGRKRSLYEGGVRVPGIVRYPRRVAAGRADLTSVLSAADFLPTVASLAGLAPPAGHTPDGEDMSDVLTRAPRPRRTPLYWDWRFRIFNHVRNRSPQLAVRDGDLKLLCNPDRSRVELYDIPRDPGEEHNLAEHRPDDAARLVELALAWRASLPPSPGDPDAGRADYPFPAEQPGTPPA